MLRSKWAVGKARGGSISESIRDRRATRPPAHFHRNLRAGASWLFFRVARSTRMTQIWVLRSRLEKQPTDLRQYACYFGDRTLGSRVPARAVLGATQQSSARRFQVSRSALEERLAQPSAETSNSNNPSFPFSLTLLASSVSAATFPY